ncbi:hypothetical protein C8Q76DRAFT_689815 [Earliella scabrosa]|nr:hypothetical protein C8Q76DRAFT_803417 [Earliella scabrosa]KAI0741229.1 hypothetical protein C8Q76DRAFT_689815 [Earliella scabrosa]
MAHVSRSTVQRNLAENRIRRAAQSLDIAAQIRDIEDDLDHLPLTPQSDGPSHAQRNTTHHLPTHLDHSTVAEIIQLENDFSHLYSAFVHNSISFTLSGRTLRFLHPPSGPYERYELGSVEGYNIGRFALNPSHLANRHFIAYHTWLIVTYETLPPVPRGAGKGIQDMRTKLTAALLEEVQRLEDMKEIEWEAQQHLHLPVADDDGFRDVDTCEDYFAVH